MTLATNVFVELSRLAAAWTIFVLLSTSQSTGLTENINTSSVMGRLTPQKWRQIMQGLNELFPAMLRTYMLINLIATY